MRSLVLLGCLAAVTHSLCAQEQTPRPAITGIAFARFYTTDNAAAEKFYGQTLGFERITEPALWIYPVNHQQWIEVVHDQTPPQANVRMAAVGFTTRDVLGLQRYLVEKGIPTEASPQKDCFPAVGRYGFPRHASGPATGMHPFSSCFSVRDPEGNLVVFVESGAEQGVAQAKPSPAASSTRLIHAGFMVRDRERENHFWIDILGFRPYWHGGHAEGVTDWVSMQVPEGHDWIEYMLNAAPEPTLRQFGGMDHISLGVAHMQDAVAALARNHCEGPNCTKTQMGRDGKVQLNLFDPDQTRIEFMEFAPAQEPCCSAFTASHPTADEDK